MCFNNISFSWITEKLVVLEDQRDFGRKIFFSAEKCFFSAENFNQADGIAWKNACLVEMTTGFCLKAIYSNYTFDMKNIFACYNALIEKIARRNSMSSEILHFFFTNFAFSRNTKPRPLIPLCQTLLSNNPNCIPNGRLQYLCRWYSF